MTLKLIALVVLGYKLLGFKSLHMKLFCVSLYYPIIVLFFFQLNVQMAGILEYYRNDFSEHIIEIGFWSYYIGLVVFYCILHRLKTKNSPVCYVFFSNKIRILFFLCFIICSIPVLNIHNDGGLKSSSLYLLFGTLLILSHRCRDFIWLLHLMLCFAIVLLGERVDSVMQIIFLLIKKTDTKESDSLSFKHYLYGFIFFAFLVVIGFTRNEGGGSWISILSAVYSQQTVTDVVYIFLTGIKYYYEYGTNLSVLNCLLTGLLPGGGISSDYCFTNILREYMPNWGGGLFFTEGFMIFGPIGVLLYCTIYAFVLRLFFVSTKQIHKWYYVLLFVMMLRIVWYGYLYAYKPFVVLTILYIILSHNKRITI